MLIIDDQHSVRVSLSFLLDNAGYRVLAAETGRAGMALFEREPIDGALIDVHMPGMNGFETCIALQSKAACLHRSLHVWFMTGAFTSDVQRRGVELGALGVFRKPFEFPSFLAQLEAGLSTAAPSPSSLPALSCAVLGDADQTGPS